MNITEISALLVALDGRFQCYRKDYGRLNHLFIFIILPPGGSTTWKHTKTDRVLENSLRCWKKEKKQEKKKEKDDRQKGSATDRRRQMPPFGISTKAPESSSPRAIAALELNEVGERVGEAQLTCVFSLSLSLALSLSLSLSPYSTVNSPATTGNQTISRRGSQRAASTLWHL